MIVIRPSGLLLRPNRDYTAPLSRPYCNITTKVLPHPDILTSPWGPRYALDDRQDLSALALRSWRLYYDCTATSVRLPGLDNRSVVVLSV